VTVTAKMVEQQTTRTAQTNAEGFYTMLALPPGNYEMAFEVKGFQKLAQTGLELTVGQNLRVDSTLQVGAVETQVTVGPEAPPVDTTSATITGLIDDRRVVDLPLNGRNIMSLARILPGVLNVSAPKPWATRAAVRNCWPSSREIQHAHGKDRLGQLSFYALPGVDFSIPQV
jgi:hypothetical protein